MMKHAVRPRGPFTSRPLHTAELIGQTGRHLALDLAEDLPHKVRGYDPYDTVAYANDALKKDVWQHKAKRT
jgi:hypothetical protein